MLLVDTLRRASWRRALQRAPRDTTRWFRAPHSIVRVALFGTTAPSQTLAQCRAQQARSVTQVAWVPARVPGIALPASTAQLEAPMRPRSRVLQARTAPLGPVRQPRALQGRTAHRAPLRPRCVLLAPLARNRIPPARPHARSAVRETTRWVVRAPAPSVRLASGARLRRRRAPTVWPGSGARRRPRHA